MLCISLHAWMNYKYTRLRLHRAGARGWSCVEVVGTREPVDRVRVRGALVHVPPRPDPQERGGCGE